MKKVQTYKIYEYNELDVVNPVNRMKVTLREILKSHAHALVAIYGSKSSSSSTINKENRKKNQD